MSVGIFTPISGRDGRWVDQWLRGVERLGCPFAAYLDRCDDGIKEKVTGHPLCVFYQTQDDPKLDYTEQHKQPVLNFLQERRFTWALQLDVDETLERGAREKLPLLDRVPSYVWCVDCRWPNLFGSPDYVRTDRNFSPTGDCYRRSKLYRLDVVGMDWVFRSQIVYGPTPHVVVNGQGKYVENQRSVPFPEATRQGEDLVCFHWGYMTKELRAEHRDRWNHNYGVVVGKNPYNMWEMMCDEETYPPTFEANPYEV